MAEQICLTWKKYETHMVKGFYHLYINEKMTDVTLVCDSLSLKAHKIVLSACSPVLQSLFLANPCKHPIVIFKDIKYSDMKVLLDFIYSGEVNISEDQLCTLTSMANILNVKGFSEATIQRAQANKLSQPSVSGQNHLSEPSVSGQDPSQMSVTRSDDFLSKRRKLRSQKSPLNDQSDGKTPQSGNPDSDVEEVFSSNLPLEVGANETFPPEEGSVIVPNTQLSEESSQNNIVQEDQSNMEQENGSQSRNNPSSKSVSIATNTSEIVNKQPECSAINIEKEIPILQKAIKTLQLKGMLPMPTENVQSADKESSRSNSDMVVAIIDEDSDIEEIIPIEKPRQEQTIELDDDEYDEYDDDEIILTDVIVGPDSSEECSQETNKQINHLPSTHSKQTSGTSRGEKMTVNENQVTNGSVSQGEPSSKRRKRRRPKKSNSNKNTNASNSEVLQLDSDIEEISSDSISSDSNHEIPECDLSSGSSFVNVQNDLPQISDDNPEAPSGITKEKRISEKVEHSNRSASLQEPPSKRRKHRRQNTSNYNRSTGDDNSIVLQLDSDIEEIPNEPSSSISTTTKTNYNLISCQLHQLCPDVQPVDEIFASKVNSSLECNKLPKKTLSANDGKGSTTAVKIKSSCYSQQQHPHMQDEFFVAKGKPEATTNDVLSHSGRSTPSCFCPIQVQSSASEVNYQYLHFPSGLVTGLFNHRAIPWQSEQRAHSSIPDATGPVSLPERNDEQPETPSGQLVIKDHVLPIVEAVEIMLVQVNMEHDDQNDDGVQEKED